MTHRDYLMIYVNGSMKKKQCNCLGNAVGSASISQSCMQEQHDGREFDRHPAQ